MVLYKLNILIQLLFLRTDQKPVKMGSIRKQRLAIANRYQIKYCEKNQITCLAWKPLLRITWTKTFCLDCCLFCRKKYLIYFKTTICWVVLTIIIRKAKPSFTTRDEFGARGGLTSGIVRSGNLVSIPSTEGLFAVYMMFLSPQRVPHSWPLLYYFT